MLIFESLLKSGPFLSPNFCVASEKGLLRILPLAEARLVGTRESSFSEVALGRSSCLQQSGLFIFYGGFLKVFRVVSYGVFMEFCNIMELLLSFVFLTAIFVNHPGQNKFSYVKAG